MRSERGRRWMAGLLVLWMGAGALSGCSSPQCDQIRDGYKAALDKEPTLLKRALSAELPTHFALAIRYDTVLDVAARRLDSSMPNALALEHTLALGPKTALKVRLRGKAQDVRLMPDTSCDRCFRLVGDIGGAITMDNPLVTNQEVPVSGSFSLVGAMSLERGSGGAASLKLDMSKLESYKASFVSLEFEQLPDTWTNALRQSMARALRAHMAKTLGSLALFEFNAPKLGIQGVQTLTTKISFLDKQRALFVGFTSNLPGVDAAHSLTPESVVKMGEGEQVAVAVQPRLLSSMVALGLGRGALARKHKVDGTPDKKGAAHVTVRQVSVAANPKTPGGDVTVGMQVWHQGKRKACYRFDSTVSGPLSLKRDTLDVALREVKHGQVVLPEDADPVGAPPTGAWANAPVVRAAARYTKAALGQPQLTIPGLRSTLTPSSLERSDEALLLRATLTLDGPAPTTKIGAASTPAGK